MVVKVVKAKTKIGPQHQGHKMSLRAFEFAEVEEGYLYELARGVIVVGEVANYYHLSQIDVLQEYLQTYKSGHRGIIHRIAGGSDCKLLMPKWESERHPDIAIYLTRPRGKKDSTMWRTWIPDVIIEVVSPSSVERDYVEKREEYWTLGAKEYWIVDAAMGKVTQLRRGKNDWIGKELEAGDSIETKLLPGLKVPCKAIFDAAGPGDEDE
jgi:Uma2 family endonuclease